MFAFISPGFTSQPQRNNAFKCLPKTRIALMKKSIVSFLIVPMLFGCAAPKPKVDISAEAKALICTKPEAVSDEITLDLQNMGPQTVSMLRKKEYEKLEKQAAEFRKSKEAYASGRWKLDTFYRSFSEHAHGKLKQEEFEERIKMVKDWIQARPNDIASKVALSGLYQKYAWHARGGGYAGTVKEEGWKLMAERNGAALKILNELRAKPQHDPRMFYLLLQVAKDESFDKPKYDEIFQASLREFPTYRSSYFSKVLDLQPRWGGEDGEWEEFAKAEADKLKGAEGDKLYAQLVWAVIYTGWYRGDNLFKIFKLDSQRALAGMAAIRKEYPKSFEALSANCSMAIQAGDYELAAKLFQELEGQMAHYVWHGSKSFIYWRDQLFN